MQEEKSKFSSNAANEIYFSRIKNPKPDYVESSHSSM